ncbi:hypothetical protein Taro_019276 [Colocasia esculenta]|uniref:Uncharacterized protein n=1 Tax=Colocasia esculenta TaxID=4460 RepID=A0A843UKP2_COLES|nr:hypothetical protein [Colocasia esculenta]
MHEIRAEREREREGRGERDGREGGKYNIFLHLVNVNHGCLKGWGIYSFKDALLQSSWSRLRRPLHACSLSPSLSNLASSTASVLAATLAGRPLQLRPSNRGADLNICRFQPPATAAGGSRIPLRQDTPTD